MTPTSRRERNRQVNHTTLVSASRTVFATRGYDDATIQHIVQASGLSRGTFYNYLGDKETAFREVASELMTDLAVRITRPAGPPASASAYVEEVLQSVVQLLTRDAETLALVTHSGAHLRACLHRLPITARIADDVRSTLAEVEGNGQGPGLPPEWTAHAVMGACIEVCTRLEGGTPETAGQFLRTFLIGGVRGFANS